MSLSTNLLFIGLLMNQTKKHKHHSYGMFKKDTVSRLMTKPTKRLYAQRRLRSAWASARSVQSLRCPYEESLGP